MTRNAWVTVRLPGASTAPATRTRTCCQTGAVKHGRNTDSQAARTDGTSDGTDTAAAPGGFAFIAVLESTPVRNARGPRGATAVIRPGILSLMTDPIIQHIEAFRCGQPGNTIASKFSTGHSGRSDGLPEALSDARSYRLIVPSSSSQQRTFSGPPHSPAPLGNCGKSS